MFPVGVCMLRHPLLLLAYIIDQSHIEQKFRSNTGLYTKIGRNNPTVGRHHLKFQMIHSIIMNS